MQVVVAVCKDRYKIKVKKQRFTREKYNEFVEELAFIFGKQGYTTIENENGTTVKFVKGSHWFNVTIEKFKQACRRGAKNEWIIRRV